MCKVIKLLLFLILSESFLYSQGNINPIAMIVKVEGEVFVINNKQKTKAVVYMPLYVSDIIQTMRNSSLELIFDNGVSFRVEESCNIEIRKINTQLFDKKGLSEIEMEINITSGKFLVDTKTVKDKYKLQSMKVFSPTVTAAVRGTVFCVVVDDKQDTTIAVFEGKVESNNDKEKVLVEANNQLLSDKKSGRLQVGRLTTEMIEYRDKIVASFLEKVSYYRSEIEVLKQKRQEFIENSKKDFNKKIDEQKKEFEKKYRR